MNKEKPHVLITGLYIGDGAYGGIVNFNRLLVKYLRKHNFKTDFFSIGKSPSWYKGKEKITQAGYHFKILIKAFKFCTVIRRTETNVVIINSNLSISSLVRDGFFSLIARFCGAKTIYIFHGWLVNDYNKILKNHISSRLFKLLLKSQNIIGASSINHIESINKLEIRGIKTFTFSTMVESELYKPRSGSIKDIDVLFAANPLSEQKGIREFLEAISVIVKKMTSLKVVIIGGGNELEKYRNISKILETEKNIDFVGYIDNNSKISLFQRSKTFVLPSYSEGFPNVVIEAMAAHSALIVTPVGGLSEAISNNTNGMIINSMPPDPKEIAHQIFTLLTEKELLNTIIQNNITEVRYKYDVDVVAKLFEKMVLSLNRD